MSELRPVRLVRKIRTREVVPQTEFPNFKSAGRSVEGPLMRLLCNLVRKYGESWVAEPGLRRMVCEDTGRMPGLDTVRVALRRLERQGLLEQDHLLSGGILPDGNVCLHGTRRVRVLGPHGRRAIGDYARRKRMLAPTTNRVSPRQMSTLAEVRGSTFQPRSTAPAVERRQRDAEAKRGSDVQRLRELAAEWEREKRDKPPPD